MYYVCSCVHVDQKTFVGREFSSSVWVLENKLRFDLVASAFTICEETLSITMLREVGNFFFIDFCDKLIPSLHR